MGCTHAIHVVRSIITSLTQNGSTVNICSLDLSKAFDKANHYGLLLKLTKRLIPNCLLNLLEVWMSNCFSCIKWHDYYSDFLKLKTGVRQGSVLSPILFAIYIDDLISTNNRFSIVVYADDILLISPSVSRLQELFSVCEFELVKLDMDINVSKTCCIRIGNRHKSPCANITNANGLSIPWVEKLKYLGITIVASTKLKCSFDLSKRKFYRAANAIFSKLGRAASEEVILQLFATKCLPVLLYATEVCPLTKNDLSSLDFAVNRFLFKLFKTSSIQIINDARYFFGFKLPNELIVSRVATFKQQILLNNNLLCRVFSTVENMTY